MSAWHSLHKHRYYPHRTAFHLRVDELIFTTTPVFITQTLGAQIPDFHSFEALKRGRARAEKSLA